MLLGDVSNVAAPRGFVATWQRTKFSITGSNCAGVVSGKSRVLRAMDKPMLVSRVDCWCVSLVLMAPASSSGKFSRCGNASSFVVNARRTIRKEERHGRCHLNQRHVEIYDTVGLLCLRSELLVCGRHGCAQRSSGC